MNIHPFPLTPARSVPVSVSIVAALRIWRTWSIDIPPTGATGDQDADRRLARFFHELAAADGQDARLRLIEAHVFARASDFTPPGAPVDLFRETVMRWWLDIFDDLTPAACDHCKGLGVIFECRLWPGCNCPGGAPMERCPGTSRPCDCQSRPSHPQAPLTDGACPAERDPPVPPPPGILGECPAGLE